MLMMIIVVTIKITITSTRKTLIEILGSYTIPLLTLLKSGYYLKTHNGEVMIENKLHSLIAKAYM